MNNEFITDIITIRSELDALENDYRMARADLLQRRKTAGALAKYNGVSTRDILRADGTKSSNWIYEGLAELNLPTTRAGKGINSPLVPDHTATATVTATPVSDAPPVYRLESNHTDELVYLTYDARLEAWKPAHLAPDTREKFPTPPKIVPGTPLAKISNTMGRTFLPCPPEIPLPVLTNQLNVAQVTPEPLDTTNQIA